MTLTFDEDLALGLRAQLPLLIVDSVEEVRVVNRAAGVCRQYGMRLITWDLAGGFFDWSDHRPLSPTTDPHDVIARLAHMSVDTLVVLKDFHPLLADDRRLVRALRSFGQRDWRAGPTAMIVGPGATIPPELADEAEVLRLPPPDLHELGQAFDRIASKLWLASPPPPDARERIVRAALGLTLVQAERAFVKAGVADGVVDARDVQLVLAEKRALIAADGALEYLEPAVQLSDIGGLKRLKSWLRSRERTFGAEARAFGIPPPKGMALVGIPGTGKSLTAKTIAVAWDIPLLRLDVGAIFNRFMGESEARARRALQVAETIAPCVLWIDEIEKALGTGGLDGGTALRVVSTLLTWMAEKTAPVFVVATANRVDQVPTELLRRGRFDEVFFLDLPTPQERLAILAVHLRRADRNPRDYDLWKVVAATDTFTGAELEQAVVDALVTAFNAGRSLTTDDLLEAADHLVPLAVSQREEVEALRRWLREGRATVAS